MNSKGIVCQIPSVINTFAKRLGRSGACVLRPARLSLPPLASKPCVAVASFVITQILEAILQPLKAKHRKVARHNQRRLVVVACKGNLRGVMYCSQRLHNPSQPRDDGFVRFAFVDPFLFFRFSRHLEFGSLLDGCLLGAFRALRFVLLKSLIDYFDSYCAHARGSFLSSVETCFLIDFPAGFVLAMGHRPFQIGEGLVCLVLGKAQGCHLGEIMSPGREQLDHAC